MKSIDKCLAKVGYLALLMPIFIVLILVVLHGLYLFNAWMFPLIPVSIFCIFVGICCLIGAWSFRVVRLHSLGINKRNESRAIRSRWRYRWSWAVGLFLLSINLPAYIAAYYMTHVRLPGQFRLGLPKPTNSIDPLDRGLPYTTVNIPINASEWLEVWKIESQMSDSKGTVVLFPGNLGTKSSQLLGPAQSFISLGYDAILVDFQGVGGSSGNTVTIGIQEAEDVAVVFNYLKEKNRKQGNLDSPIIFYGVSMGSAAILRSISMHQVSPDAIILELPFLRLIDAVRVRLQYHKIPTILVTELLIFWGGVQHGFNGFGHNPLDFARGVDCPVLLLHGQQDKWVTTEQMETLIQTFPGSKKQLVVSPDAGHQQLIGVNRQLWDLTVHKFLSSL